MVAPIGMITGTVGIFPFRGETTIQELQQSIEPHTTACEAFEEMNKKTEERIIGAAHAGNEPVLRRSGALLDVTA